MGKQYITAKEFRTVNARSSFAARPLTATEEVIKQLKDIYEWPETTQSERKLKEEAFKNLSSPVNALGDSSHHQWLEEAIRFPVRIPALVQRFPQVEFYEVLNGTSKPNTFVEMYRAQVDVTVLEQAVKWLMDMQRNLAKLPIGVKAFIGTPETDYWEIQQAHKAGHCVGGMAIPNDLQTEFNTLMQEGNYYCRHVIFHHDLLSVPLADFERRGLLSEEDRHSLVRPFNVRYVSAWESYAGGHLSYTRTEDDGKETVYNFVV